MDWLNYHHLMYFWTVAREGSVSRAAERLMLAQPTISAQIAALEKSIGEPLFSRVGRRMVLTDAGRTAFAYADQIFSLGREMMDTLRQQPGQRPLRLSVGLADVVPKLIAHRLLGPALHLKQATHVICREDKVDRLLAELMVFGLDVVISDAPVPPGVKVKAFSHPLLQSGISIFGVADLARKARRRFPKSLDQAPMLLPTENTALRRSLDRWFEGLGVRPHVVAEFEDSALLKVFGQTGMGLFAAPSVIEKEVCRQYQVSVAGQTEEVRERFYAISLERRLRHPAVLAMFGDRS